MIEVQIKVKEIYNELKQYSNYHSDLTQVCSFRDEIAPLLKEYNIDFDEEAIKNSLNGKNKEKPTLTIQGRNIMKLEGAPAEMLYFVGVRSEFDPTISVRNMNEVYLLVKNNLVKTDEKFDKLYSKMSYRSKINEMIASNVKFYGKGKVLDYVDGDLTITSLKFNEAKETPIVYKQFDIKITSPLEEKEKFSEFSGVDKSGNKVTLRFYVRSIILKSIAFKGNKISISAPKVQVLRNGVHMVYDPTILPSGLTYIKETMFSPINRKIPVDLWRNIFYEFRFRYELGK